MHLAESRLDAHVHGRKVRMRCHYSYNTASHGVEPCGNNAEDDILAGEDTGDGSVVLYQDGRGMVLLHQ